MPVFLLVILIAGFGSNELTASKDIHFRCSAMLTSGSSGVPRHLTGELRVKTDALEFDAYPQIYTVTWPCKEVRQTGAMRSKRTAITFRLSTATYRFDLGSHEAVIRFINAATEACH